MVQSWDTESGYGDWYASVSHPILQNPKFRRRKDKKNDGNFAGQNEPTEYALLVSVVVL